jgi:predicted membrane-bound spermidine synthase
MDMDRRYLFPGIFLLTTSVLMLELALTRLFSATLYYHLAFFAISLALLGSGSAGVSLYLFRRRIERYSTGTLLSVFSILYSLSVIVALVAILENPILRTELGDHSRLLLRLAVIYAATFLPFFTAGCAVTVAVTRFAKDISRVYLFDLAGAAIGCLLLIPVLNALGAISTVIVTGALGALAAIFFSRVGSVGKRMTIAAVAAAILVGGFGILNAATGILDIKGSKWGAEEHVLFSKWNSFSRITVVGDVARQDAKILIDADAATSVMPNAGDVSLHQDRRNDISSLAYHVKPNANSLIIGPGGAIDVSTALVFDSTSVTAVEINPIIARDVMLSEPFKSLSGNIYENPRVHLVVDEGRSFIRRSPDKYDVVQASMVDTWAATSAGAFSLTENNLYTVEAFTDYARHLTDDGVLSMTRWYLEPPDQLLRLVALSRVMMNELKIGDPARHFVIIRAGMGGASATPATFLFKKSAFTDDEVRNIESVAARNGFEILYTPLSRPENLFTQLITADDPATVWNSLETDVSPTYDNDPFFFNSLRPSSLGTVSNKPTEWLKTNVGTFVLLALLAITATLTLLFIVLPLIFAGRREEGEKHPDRFRYLVYFGCLGTGFIVIEVAMIQKFILFLGHPVYALAVILFSILLFCSLGSRLTGRFAEASLQRTVVKVIAALVVLTFLYILLLPPIFYGLVWLPLAARIVIAVVLLGPLGLLMGMPMPLGIRLLSERSPQTIPWAWGINGATSVMGSVATLVIAILSGFNQALAIGAAVYVIAGLLIFFSSDKPPPSTEA